MTAFLDLTGIAASAYVATQVHEAFVQGVCWIFALCCAYALGSLNRKKARR